MNTFFQVLRLAFWMNPLQRVCTGMGVLIMVVGSILALPFGMPGSTLPAPFLGFLLVSAASLLAGGVYWRLVSAPRIVRLAPHGRSRLLVSVFALVLLIAVLWMLQYWLFFLLWVEPRFYPTVSSQFVGMVGFMVSASTLVVGMFIASRSPTAALGLLIWMAVPGILAWLLDIDLLPRKGPAASLVMLGVIWIPFSIWYLRARRINRPSMLVAGGQDVLATATVSVCPPRSRDEAVRRQLLGGSSVVRLSVQWFAAAGLLLGIQWVLARVGEPSDQQLVTQAMYASLLLCPVVTTLVSSAAIRRSRVLWLVTGSSRAELFAIVERVLFRVTRGLALTFAVWFAVLWITQLPKPPAGTVLAFATLVLMGQFATYAQLAWLPRWPTAIFAGVGLMLIWRLATVWFAPEVQRPGAAIVALLMIVGIATAALRGLAQRRWRDGDFPRSANVAAPLTSWASGT
jgi:hypothetical protein